MSFEPLRILTALATALLVAGCGRSTPSPPGSGTGGEQVVNVYNWFDYLRPETLQEFEAQTGIHVRYDIFDSNNTLEAKLLTGRSGYDVVFPSAAYLQRMKQAGVFRTLDRSQLKNLGNLDPAIQQRLAAYDPGNEHAVVYTWGITGFGYDVEAVRALLPDAPLDSWSMLFDPKIASRLAGCGIGLYESPNVIFPSVLAWLGEDPNSEDPRALERAAQALSAVRPFIRKVTDGSLVDDLATGELCVVIASNGDAIQARDRAHGTGRDRKIAWSSPREGAVMWFDVAAIVADAPHPQNALRFIDFLLDGKVAAENSNAIGFPNGNAASQALLRPELRNATTFPDAARAAKLFPELPKSEDYVRQRTRLWTRFRTGE